MARQSQRRRRRKPKPTSITIWITTKAKLQQILSRTRQSLVVAMDIALDHELDRLGLDQPEATQSAASESET